MSILPERFQRLQGELAWVLTGHAAAFLGGLLGIKVLTGLLGPAGYGELALGLTIAGTVQAYLYWPLANVVSRYYTVYRDQRNLPAYFAALFHLHGRLLAWLLPVGLMVTLVVWLTPFSRWSGILAVGLLFGLVAGVGTSYGAYQTAIRDRFGAALAQGADVWLRIGLGIAAVLFIWRSGAAALAGYCLGTVLVLFWQHRQVMKGEGALLAVADCSGIGDVRREFVGYALPFAGYAAFTAVTLYADRWILQGTSGAQAVGIYAALFQIAASPVNIFFAVVNQLMLPIVYERAGAMSSEISRTETRRLIGRIVAVAGTVSLLMALLFWWFDEQLVSLLTSPSFLGHANIMVVLLVGLALWQLGQLLTLVANSMNRPGAYFAVKAGHALLFCTAGIVLALRYGVPGMAWAYLLSSLLYCAGIWLVNRRLLHLSPVPPGIGTA